MSNVVHIIGQLGYGGTERQLYLLLKHRHQAMPDTEHTVVVFNQSEHGDYRDLLEQVGVRVVDGGPSVARRLKVVRQQLRTVGAAVLHSWSPFTNGYAAMAARMSSVEQCIGSFRSSILSGDFASLPGPYRWLCIRGCQQLIVNSREISQELQSVGVDQQRIRHIQNCVEIPGDIELQSMREQSRSELRSELGLPQDAFIIGMISNLRPPKNHGLAIQALSQFVDSTGNSDAHLVIVGQTFRAKSDYYEEVLRRIAASGLEDRVHLLGFREDARRVLAGYDLLCLSSKPNSEGMPNAIIEAMAHGLPVVATRVGGVPELVDESVGCLTEPGDADELAAAFETLSTNANLRRAMGRAALEYARVSHGTVGNAETFARIYSTRICRAA